MRIFGFIVLLTLFSCRKDVPPERPQENVSLSSTGGVFVLNEGNFMFSNSKISYHNLSESATIVDLYEQTNGSGVGDVLQSMVIFNSKAYVVVNNSGKIEVCHPVTLEKLNTISGFTSPRYFLPVSNNKAYVTDLYADKVWIVNLVNNTISGSIPLNGWSEELVEVYGKVFVTNYERGKLFVIDPITDQLSDSLTLTEGAGFIRQDKNGKLWVLCSGNSSTSINPVLYILNPITLSIDQQLNLAGSPFRLTANSTADTMYYLDNGVMRIPVDVPSVPSGPLISQGTSNFYGLGIQPLTGRIFVADAVDYIQDGRVLIYKPDGAFVKDFSVGIIPSTFVFQ